MDRRSWLWRRKSSEKSPGCETESTGSVSSYSERFFDDQAYAAPSSQSPEVTSKAELNDEDVINESVKTLKDSLSAAILDIRTKEDLVKQHAKVAEEAITGWEKAENEVSVSKKKLEAANQKNSALEDHLGHLDQALKECVRQLRQAREEQEHNIHEAVSKKTQEWESLKSLLESQLADLRSAKSEALAVIDSDLQQKLEAAEKENSTLKSELRSQAKELEIAILERDLSIKAAETASKQHLENVKKVSKLEAECLRLNALVRKKSLSTSDSQSDILEPSEYEPSRAGSWVSTVVMENQLKTKPMNPLVEINLMDDFLEMERLAAIPQQHREGNFSAALDAAIQRSADFEKKLEDAERENAELETALGACQKRLQDSRGRLFEAETELQELKKRLFLAEEVKKDADERVEAAQRDKESAELQTRVVENEVSALNRRVGFLEGEVRKERALSADSLVKCKKLEDELLSTKLEAEKQKESEQKRIENTKVDAKFRQEKELSLAAGKFAECQKTIASLGIQLKSLASLEDFLIGDTTQVHGNGIVQNPSSSKLSLTKRDSEFKDRVNDYLHPLKNMGERVSASSLT